MTFLVRFSQLTNDLKSTISEHQALPAPKLNNLSSFAGFSCLVGLLFVTRAGEYWVTLFDAYAGSYALMAVAFWEVVAVGYIYGYDRFLDDIQVWLLSPNGKLLEKRK